MSEPDIVLTCHEPVILITADKQIVVISAQEVCTDKDGRPALSGKTLHLRLSSKGAEALLQQLEPLRPFFGWKAAEPNQLKVEFAPPKSEQN